MTSRRGRFAAWRGNCSCIVSGGGVIMSSQLDNVTKLFRIRKTALEMLNDRGYLVPSVSLLMSLYSSGIHSRDCRFVYVVSRIEAQDQIGKDLFTFWILLLYQCIESCVEDLTDWCTLRVKALQLFLWTQLPCFYCFHSGQISCLSISYRRHKDGQCYQSSAAYLT